MIAMKAAIKDINKVLRLLSNLKDVHKLGMKEVANMYRSAAIEGTPVGKTGKLRRSWGAVRMTSTGYSFTNRQPYAVTIEDGLYPQVGPRTVAFDGGIYSSQAPGGILGPLVEDDDLRDVSLAILENALLEVFRDA